MHCSSDSSACSLVAGHQTFKRSAEHIASSYSKTHTHTLPLEKELAKAPVRGDTTRASTLYDLISVLENRKPGPEQTERREC